MVNYISVSHETLPVNETPLLDTDHLAIVPTPEDGLISIDDDSLADTYGTHDVSMRSVISSELLEKLEDPFQRFVVAFDSIEKEAQHAREIARLRSQLDQATYNATHNELSELPNRVRLHQKLDEQIKNNPGEFALVFLDVNGLKVVNDEQGHSAGDDLIQRTAETLQHTIRHKADHRDLDTLGRTAFHLSGDEFVILLAGVSDPEILSTVIKRIDDNLSLQKISAAMGGKVHDINETSEQLLDSTDKIMYKEKMRLQKEEERRRPLRQRIGLLAIRSTAKLSGLHLDKRAVR